MRDNWGVRWQLRTGDKAVIALVGGIAVYERFVRDDADLISNRVAHYRKTAPVLVDAIILVTALHLAEKVEPEWDVFHWVMRYFRGLPVTAPSDPQTHSY